MHSKKKKKHMKVFCKFLKIMRSGFFGTIRRKWKRYVNQHLLDPNVDEQEGCKRMERLCLRLLIRVSKLMYLHLAKEIAAKPMVNGDWP